MEFFRGPTGVAARVTDLLSDQNTGVSTSFQAITSAIETGASETGLGITAAESNLPPIMGALEFDPVPSPTGPILATPRHTYFTEEETRKKGYTLATDQNLWEAQFPTVPWEQGMTLERGIAIKDLQDEQVKRDHFMKDHPIISFAGQLVGGSASPENYIPIFGELGAAWKIGRAAKVALEVGKGAAEGALGTAAYDLGAMEEREALGRDTSWKAFAQDVAFSAIIGGTFSGAVQVGASLFDVPASNSLKVKNIINTPETRAKANAVMNNAIGSFLNSVDNQITLGPQSYSFLRSNLVNIPQEAINLNWEHLSVNDAGEVQRYTESQLLNDPEIASMMEGTQVATERGTPMVVYTGALEAFTKRRPELGAMGLFDEFEAGKPLPGSIWFSSEPAHIFRGVDLPDLIEGQDYDVYHGTREAFDKYDPNKLGSNIGASDTEAGFMFVDNPETASGYSEIDFNASKDLFNLSDEQIASLGEKEAKKYEKLMTKLIATQKELETNIPSTREKELKKLLNKLEKQIDTVTLPLLTTPGANVRPDRIHLKNPLIVNEMPAPSMVEQRRNFINEAKDKGNDGVIIKGTADFGDSPGGEANDTTYIVFKPENIRSQFEPPIPRSPTIMPALVDMKNPLVVNMEDLRKAVTPQVKIEPITPEATTRVVPDEEFNRQPSPEDLIIQVGSTSIDTRKTGDNTYNLEITGGSELSITVEGDHVKIGIAKVPQKQRGKGYSTALIEAAVKFANNRGLPLRSDNKVISSSFKAYAALKNKGYSVKENPSGLVEIKNGLKSKDGGWVYEVTRGEAKLPSDRIKIGDKGNTKPFAKIGGKVFIGGEHLEALQQAIDEFGIDSPEIKAFEDKPEDKLGIVYNDKYYRTHEQELGGPRDDANYFQESVQGARELGQTDILPGDMRENLEARRTAIQEPEPEAPKGPGLTAEERIRLIEQAKEGKHDGVIVKGIKDASGKETTQYATWQPDNIMQLPDASAVKMQKTVNEKLAVMNSSSNAISSPGYSYNPAPSMPSISLYDTPGMGIDINALAKESNINKFLAQVSKAEGLDLDNHTTPLDEDFNASIKAKPMDADHKRAYEENEIMLQRADMIEELLRIATGCK